MNNKINGDVIFKIFDYINLFVILVLNNIIYFNNW